MSSPGDRVRSAATLGPNKEKALSTDWYTKLVLTVIAASAAFLVAEHLNATDGGSQEGRFRLQAIPMGRILLRLDTETGKTWSAALNQPKAWEEIADSPIDTLLDDAPAPEASAADPAPPSIPATNLKRKQPEAPPGDDS
jgi:hypothetical protein